MQISIITAIDKNRLIGNGNRLPWSLPMDLLRFKRITWGKPIIMGRHTFDSIGRPLPGRKNIILSRHQPEYAGCLVYDSLQKAIEDNNNEKELFIIGGEDLYRQAITIADRLYLTTIHHAFSGDSYFPEWDCTAWEILEQEECMPDSQNQYRHTFQVWKRK